MNGLIDFNQSSLWISAASILFNPTFWNIAATQEYRNKVITKTFGGNPRLGCYALAVTIFSLGIFRDYLYNEALAAQPTHPTLLSPLIHYSAIPLFISGQVLTLTSMWALGVTGTYLGDYFGIRKSRPDSPRFKITLTAIITTVVALANLNGGLKIVMDAPVTSFPFNVSDAPMYHGSTLSFLATAIWYGKPAGILLTGLVATAYSVARRWEDPFTGMIYEKRDRERKQGKKGL